MELELPQLELVIPPTFAEIAQFVAAPQLELALPPMFAEIAQFVSAEHDTLDRGVFDQQGRRLPPQYDRHVLSSPTTQPPCIRQSRRRRG